MRELGLLLQNHQPVPEGRVVHHGRGQIPQEPISRGGAQKIQGGLAGLFEIGIIDQNQSAGGQKWVGQDQGLVLVGIVVGAIIKIQANRRSLGLTLGLKLRLEIDLVIQFIKLLMRARVKALPVLVEHFTRTAKFRKIIDPHAGYFGGQKHARKERKAMPDTNIQVDLTRRQVFENHADQGCNRKGGHAFEIAQRPRLFSQMGIFWRQDGICDLRVKIQPHDNIQGLKMQKLQTFNKFTQIHGLYLTPSALTSSTPKLRIGFAALACIIEKQPPFA